MADFSMWRLFRWGATAWAEILRLHGMVADWNNRWRLVENARGRKLNHSNMRSYYSGIILLLVPLLKFSQGMKARVSLLMERLKLCYGMAWNELGYKGGGGCQDQSTNGVGATGILVSVFRYYCGILRLEYEHGCLYFGLVSCQLGMYPGLM